MHNGKDGKMMKHWIAGAIAALLLANHAAAAQGAMPAAAPAGVTIEVAAVDDGHVVEIAAVVQNEIGMRCDTCATAQSLINAAALRLPTARNTNVYAVNARTGMLVGIYLNYLGPGEQEVREIAVDPLVKQWVANVGQVCRDNGNSLNLKTVVRADGSMYWVKANGTREELKDADPRLDSGFSPMDGREGLNDAPPNSAPIDLRGFQFPPGFSRIYPAFPQTSYDMAFNVYYNVNDFVRHQAANIEYGAPNGVINGTISASGSGGIVYLVNLIGGVEVTRVLTSSIRAYVPMIDGGYVLVAYDMETGVVTVLEIVDPQGLQLPTDKPLPSSYLRDHPLPFDGGSTGQGAFGSFRDWARRNNIPVTGGTPWHASGYSCTWTPGDGGGTLRCVKQS